MEIVKYCINKHNIQKIFKTFNKCNIKPGIMNKPSQKEKQFQMPKYQNRNSGDQQL